MFLGFANIYQYFIYSFSKIVVLLTLLLKILIISTEILLIAINNFIFLILKAKLAFL